MLPFQLLTIYGLFFIVTLVLWLACAIYRDFASVQREEATYKRLVEWTKWNDRWHQIGAFNRCQLAIFIYYTVYCQVWHRGIDEAAAALIGFLSIWWILFDIGFRWCQNKPLFYVGKSAWLDKLVRNATTKVNIRLKTNYTPDCVGLVIKGALLLGIGFLSWLLK